MLDLAGLSRLPDSEGPGQIGILNFNWLSARVIVDAVGARRSGDASPGHASLTQLTLVGR